MGCGVVQTKSGHYLNPIYTTQLDINGWSSPNLGVKTFPWSGIHYATGPAPALGSTSAAA